jgi:hypothetical protein
VGVPPFAKGGTGGILQGMPEPNRREIPPSPPLQRGETGITQAVPMPAGVCLRVARRQPWRGRDGRFHNSHGKGGSQGPRLPNARLCRSWPELSMGVSPSAKGGTGGIFSGAWGGSRYHPYSHGKEINDAWAILNRSELIVGATEVELALDRLAGRIADALADRFPVALCIMGGAVVFAGKLLPRLGFPLEFDYLHATRYRDGTRGGEIEWSVLPRKSLAGRMRPAHGRHPGRRPHPGGGHLRENAAGTGGRRGPHRRAGRQGHRPGQAGRGGFRRPQPARPLRAGHGHGRLRPVAQSCPAFTQS